MSVENPIPHEIINSQTQETRKRKQNKDEKNVSFEITTELKQEKMEKRIQKKNELANELQKVRTELGITQSDNEPPSAIDLNNRLATNTIYYGNNDKRKNYKIRFDNESVSVDFNEDGTFEHTFNMSGKKAVYVRGFYKKIKKEIYIISIGKYKNIEQHGLANDAISAIIDSATHNKFEIEKVTADASPAFVRSLERGIFSKQLLFADEEFDGESRSIIINLTDQEK